MQITFKKLDSELPTPSHAHDGDGGVDLYARVDETIQSEQWAMIPTGIALAIPPGYAGLVVPRSGLARRAGIGVVNGPGLIDAGYRGEVSVLLINHGDKPFDVARGDRIAQLVVVPVVRQELIEVDELDPTARSDGGFGSTGRT